MFCVVCLLGLGCNRQGQAGASQARMQRAHLCLLLPPLMRLLYSTVLYCSAAAPTCKCME